MGETQFSDPMGSWGEMRRHLGSPAVAAPATERKSHDNLSVLIADRSLSREPTESSSYPNMGRRRRTVSSTIVIILSPFLLFVAIPSYPRPPT